MVTIKMRESDWRESERTIDAVCFKTGLEGRSPVLFKRARHSVAKRRCQIETVLPMRVDKATESTIQVGSVSEMARQSARSVRERVKTQSCEHTNALQLRICPNIPTHKHFNA
ncbi:uncharacterized protein LOC115766837 [Drosophila novamexicana]|uniref:uncharacterized protein LOC115766837 n=1 Tax=Drosophila novamexicana TaxID=47314 RepID=UPI0011E5DA21|nr:uncharacterized protein LOC115766837 [Drosophila novamexicana]